MCMHVCVRAYSRVEVHLAAQGLLILCGKFIDSLFTSVGAGEASILDVSSWSTFDNLCSPVRKTDSYLALLNKDKICPAVTLVKVAFILHRQVKS